jgi:hypothetical protein
MRQISLTLNENEFDKFMSLLKSFKSAKNIRSKQIDTEDGIFGLTDDHQQIIEQRIANHLSGQSKSYTWEEVKANARKAFQDKKNNSDLQA